MRIYGKLRNILVKIYKPLQKTQVFILYKRTPAVMQTTCRHVQTNVYTPWLPIMML